MEERGQDRADGTVGGRNRRAWVQRFDGEGLVISETDEGQTSILVYALNRGELPKIRKFWLDFFFHQMEVVKRELERLEKDKYMKFLFTAYRKVKQSLIFRIILRISSLDSFQANLNIPNLISISYLGNQAGIDRYLAI